MTPYPLPEGEEGRRFVRDYLEDLVADFPFADAASRQNLFGLLLTPIVRPALDGNVPIHLAEAALERTGKTKLLEHVVGGTLLGRPMAAMQIGGSEEEIEKRITSLLLAGQSLIHLDNIGKRLDSAALSSLMTTRSWMGRLLGFSKTVLLPNEVTIVASGNNVTASAELAKRIVLIRLQPRDEHPELRTAFRHPDLPGFIRERRTTTLGILVAMVEAWKAAGRPPSKRVLGGFEAWARTVGGILNHFGFDQWLGNADLWLRRAAPDAQDKKLFVARWATVFPFGQEATAGELCEKVQIDDLFPYIAERTEKGRPAALAKLLGKLIDCPVGGFIVRARPFGAGTKYRLEPLPTEGSEGSEGTSGRSGAAQGSEGVLPSSAPVAERGAREGSEGCEGPSGGSRNRGPVPSGHPGTGRKSTSPPATAGDRPDLPSLPSQPSLPRDSSPDGVEAPSFEEGEL